MDALGNLAENSACTLSLRLDGAGPPRWNLYRLNIHTAFSVGLREPHGASRWRF